MVAQTSLQARASKEERMQLVQILRGSATSSSAAPTKPAAAAAADGEEDV